MTANRHLAIFIRSLGAGGGAERMMLNLAVEFASRGHRVDLVLARREGHYLDDVPETVRVVDLGVRSVLPALPWLARDPAIASHLVPAVFRAQLPWVFGAIPPLVDYLRQSRPDALLSALNFSNLVALWSRRLANVPTRIVVSERNMLSVRVERVKARTVRALPPLVRAFYPWADAIGAVSSGVASDLAAVLGVAPERIAVTYNPVVTPAIERGAREDPKHPWFAPDAPPVILSAGKQKPQKDFGTLIDAFARVRRERSARLVILGDGDERPALEAQVSRLGLTDDVWMPGFVQNPFAYMARARVFALSSAWEGLPGVLIQALACGCPAVSTDCPSGPAEILESGALGGLVPVHDPDAMARAISAALDAPVDREKLRVRAEFFSARNSGDRYLRLLLPGDRRGDQVLGVEEARQLQGR